MIHEDTHARTHLWQGGRARVLAIREAQDTLHAPLMRGREERRRGNHFTRCSGTEVPHNARDIPR